VCIVIVNVTKYFCVAKISNLSPSYVHVATSFELQMHQNPLQLEPSVTQGLCGNVAVGRRYWLVSSRAPGWTIVVRMMSNKTDIETQRSKFNCLSRMTDDCRPTPRAF